MAECKCLRCGYLWTPQVQIPKQCPKCHRSDWSKVSDKQRIKELEAQVKELKTKLEEVKPGINL